VIRWSTYSHTHYDEYQVMTDIETASKPIALNFYSGSATTFVDGFGGKPPSFNVMLIDPNTMLPVDYESWVFDLESSNILDSPIWYKKKDYR